MKSKFLFGGLVVIALGVGFGLNYVHVTAIADRLFHWKVTTGKQEASAKPKDNTTQVQQKPKSKHHQYAVGVTSNNTPPPVPGIIGGVQVAYDPFKPSGGPYPIVKNGEKIWIDVSIDQQLVYIFSGSKHLYTMVTSSGLDTVPDNSTPLGVYHVQSERGTWFYSSEYQEGAKYWVSWLGHGVFLFHSVPMNIQRQIIPKITADLLHKASHGCFHLTVPDAKWIYEHVPYQTTVVVEQAPVFLKGSQIYHPSTDQQNAVLATQLKSSAV